MNWKIRGSKMMALKTVTEAIMLVATIGLIAWDIYVASRPPAGDTISEIIRDTSRRYLIIPFAVGFICGHWFFN